MENRKIERRVIPKKVKRTQLWHKLSLVVLGWILARALPEVVIGDIIKDAFGSIPEVMDYIITLAPGLIPVGSLILIIQQIKKGKK